MSALGTLVRVHNWALEEKQQKLAGLQQLVDKLREDLRTAQEDLDRELKAASDSPEGIFAFPTFIAAALERRKKLRETIADVELAVEAAREEVRAAYEEVKKYEQARDMDKRRGLARQARREQTALDELAVEMHRRARAAHED